MRRGWAVLVATTAVGAVLPAAGAHAATPAFCARAAITTALQAFPTQVPDLQPTAADGTAYGSLGQARCADVTGDGLPDVLWAINSGGSIGQSRWGLLARGAAGAAPTVPVSREGGHLAVAFHDRRVRIGTPIYRRADPNCCATGGYRTRTYRWTGTSLVQASSRRTKLPPSWFRGGL